MDQTAARQPLNTSRLLIEAAEKILDTQHGEGYAVAHPEIVAAYMQTAALDFHACIFANAADHHGTMMGDLATSLGHLSGE